MAKHTAFISHPNTLLHIMDGSHPESPARITAIKHALSQSPLKDLLIFENAPLATKMQLKKAHSSHYVDYIFNISPKAGIVKLDADTSIGPLSLEATLRASGAAILATDMVMQKRVKNAFCCTRPPGHHAGISNSAGFCVFNHVAVAVSHALSKYNINKIAIIDFDVHHGDGTEEIFKNNPKVMLCSTFQHPFYPHRGADTRSQRMINVPLPANTDGIAFREAVSKEFMPALNQFKPELVFISAGFDAHKGDPLANLQLDCKDYIWITEFIKEIANKHAEGRIISVLEGGYHLDYLAESVLAHVGVLAN
jgi:acetoin utilization deacetylase AcuC-like enzyme